MAIGNNDNIVYQIWIGNIIVVYTTPYTLSNMHGTQFLCVVMIYKHITYLDNKPETFIDLEIAQWRASLFLVFLVDDELLDADA